MNKKTLVFDHFQIVDPDRDLLGRGGMGEVYRAVDLHTGETVALKILDPQVVSRDPTMLERFRREGEALLRLDHPNIVRLLAAVEANGQHCLVMEYIPGGSLEDLLKLHGKLPHDQIVLIALDLADALTRAHRLGILHRDLKPANVLLAADGSPRLADFGISFLDTSPALTQSGMLIGTIDYLSPEACRGERLDERADIWSFGVLLFELLSGQRPFQGENLTARLAVILSQPVPDLAVLAPDAPDALLDLVYRMLEKDRCQRIPSVRLVGAELEAIHKGRESRQGYPHSRFATPAPAAGKPRHNLPAQATPFVGREAELAQLDCLLSDPAVRLVTIAGVGGMGKTRLAIEAGTSQVERFSQGVYYVSLAGLRSTDEIIPAIAQSTGFSFYEGREAAEQLMDYLRDKGFLLVLDNFEHLLEGMILVGSILREAPRIKILTTSRLRLGLPEEHVYHLVGMDFPAWETAQDAIEYSGVRLFLQGAQRARPGFKLAEDDLRDVSQICRLVGGMPLGILLAAAWLEMLSPREIAEEIARSLDFLEAGPIEMPERQRSLRTIFDYSWNLLGEGERRVFASLSVFRGGFTRPAAQQVCDATLRELMTLVDHSLVQREPGGRYQVHELLCQYGTEMLAANQQAEQEVHERAAGYFTTFLQEREICLHEKEQKAALVDIGAEIENIREAWDWAVGSGHAVWLEHGMNSLAEFLHIRAWYPEGKLRFYKAAVQLESVPGEQQDAPHRLALGKAWLHYARFCDALGMTDNAELAYNASIAIFRRLGSQNELAFALCCQAGAEGLYGGQDPAPCLEGLEIFRRIRDLRGAALALHGLGWVAWHDGEYPSARSRLQESLDLSRQLQDPTGMINSSGAVGYIHWILGDYQLGKILHEEMLRLAQETGDQGGLARALALLGIDHCGLKNFHESEDYFQQSLAVFREIGNPWGIADELGDQGEINNAMGNYAAAADYARQSLDTQAKQWNSQNTWELRVYANAMCGLGEFGEARKYFRQSIEVAWSSHRLGHVLMNIAGVADMLQRTGDPERSAELLAFTTNHPATWQWARDQSAATLDRLRDQLPAQVLASAEERGRQRTLNSIVAELLVELN